MTTKRSSRLKLCPLGLLMVVILLLLATAAHARKTASGQLPDVTLQLKWHHQFQFAGYYAALEQGFYEDEGVNVSLLEGGPDVQVEKMVVSGRADFGVLGSELVMNRLKGDPVVLVAVIFQHSTRALMVLKNSKLASPSDFVGQRLMLNIPESAEFWAMFKREGIPREALNVVQKDTMAIDKLISGEVAAINGSIGAQPFIFNQRNAPVRLIRPIDYGIDFYGDALFTSEKFLQQHPDQVAAVRRATIRGWEYAMSHVDEVITLIMNKYTTNLNRDRLRFEAESMRTLILPELVNIGHVNSDRIRRIAETYAELGLAPKTFDLEGFMYNPEQPIDFRWIWWLVGVTLAIAALISAGAAILFAFNRRLHETVHARTQDLSCINKKLREQAVEVQAAQEAVRESEERMRLFFERQITGMAITSPDKNWVQVNDTLCGMLGYTREELLGLTWTELTHPDDLTQEEDQFNRLLAGETNGYILDKRFIQKDGSIIYTSLSVGSVRRPDGTVDYVLAALMDITERKQAEEALRINEKKLQHIIDTSPIGICTVDPLGNYVTTNLALEHMLGYSKKELRGLSFFDVTHPDDRPANKKLFQDMISLQTESFFIEKRYIRKDGTTIDVAIHASGIMDVDENIRFGTAFVNDITERKRLEITMTEQLEELRRWHTIMVGREDRVIKIKQEVNELLTRLDEPPRYESVTNETEPGK